MENFVELFNDDESLAIEYDEDNGTVFLSDPSFPDSHIYLNLEDVHNLVKVLKRKGAIS